MADHVVLDLMARPPVMRCDRCGAVEELNARGQRFNNAHRGCRKSAGERGA